MLPMLRRAKSICPGRYLADNTVWIAIVRLMAVFDIQKAKGADGNVIEPKIEFVTALTRFARAPQCARHVYPDAVVSSHPKPFPCDIRPRSDKAAQLISQAYDMHMANVVRQDVQS